MQGLFNELTANGPVFNSFLGTVFTVVLYALLRICNTLALIVRLHMWSRYFEQAGVRPKVHRSMVEKVSRKDLRRRRFRFRKNKQKYDQ
jgi:hypothetical protein